ADCAPQHGHELGHEGERAAGGGRGEDDEAHGDEQRHDAEEEEFAPAPLLVLGRELAVDRIELFEVGHRRTFIGKSSRASKRRSEPARDQRNATSAAPTPITRLPRSRTPAPCSSSQSHPSSSPISPELDSTCTTPSPMRRRRSDGSLPFGLR